MSLPSLPLRLATALALTALLAACGPSPDEVAAAQKAERDALEAKAGTEAAAFDKAVEARNWRLAKGLADAIQEQYAGTAAAERVAAAYPDIKREAEAEREALRLAALWDYARHTVPGGVQTTAAIYASKELDVGPGVSPVRLILRDHPSWGRSAYLVIQQGDFDCYGGCRVQVSIDGKPARALPGTRPKTDDAIAMFIDDHRGLWRMLRGAGKVRIEFPLKGLGRRSAEFEVGGLERTRMPGWD